MPVAVLLSVAAVLLSSAPLAAGALPIPNPSFESTSVLIADAVRSETAGRLTGWTSAAASGAIAASRPANVQLSPTLANLLTAGVTYTLSIYIGNSRNATNQSQQVWLLAGGAQMPNGSSAAAANKPPAQVSILYTATGLEPLVGQALAIGSQPGQ